MRFSFIILTSLIFCCLLGVTDLSAQVISGAGTAGDTGSDAFALQKPLSKDAIREMVARMSDDQVRAMLLERLDALADADEQTSDEYIRSIGQVLSETWIAFYTPILTAIFGLPVLLNRQAEAFGNFTAAFGGTGSLRLLGLLFVTLAVGYVAEILVTKVLPKRRKQLANSNTASLRGTVKFLARRLLRELLGLVIFYVVIRAVGQTLFSPWQIIVLAPAVRLLILLPRLIASLSRFVLAPEDPRLRLLSVSDKWARYIHRNLIGLGFLGGLTVFILGFNEQFGLPEKDVGIGFWLNFALHFYMVVFAWTAREGLSEMMRGEDPDRTYFDEQVARVYPYFVIALSIATWVLATIVAGSGRSDLLQNAPHYTTMIWLLMAPLIDTAIRGLVRHIQPPMIGEGRVAERAYKSNKRSMIHTGRVLALGLIVLMIAGSWDIDLANLASAGMGEQFAGNLVEFVVICAIGYILFEMVSLWVNRRLSRESPAAITSDQAGGDGGGAGGSRLATILPLILMTAQIAICTIFGLLAVGSLGIDTTPLLAGAGIVGLAIGFGAQKLVTDIVSGIFFLLDDAFRVGEYVDVGGTMGAVEKISLRSMQLRHHRGNVHTIPYGSIEKVTNFSRDWVIMKLMFTVPFDTDPNKVKKIFKKIGAEMMEDPLYKDDFLQPFKSQGVFQFDDVGIVMRGKFMAKPGTQFTIRKEIYNRVQDAFKENGIEFARREVRVAVPKAEDFDDLNDDQKEAVAAAASGALEAQLEKEASGTAKD